MTKVNFIAHILKYRFWDADRIRQIAGEIPVNWNDGQE